MKIPLYQVRYLQSQYNKEQFLRAHLKAKQAYLLYQRNLSKYIRKESSLGEVGKGGNLSLARHPQKQPPSAFRELKQTVIATATKRRQTKGFMTRIMAVHMRFKSLYISQPRSAKQQRKITKFFVFSRTQTMTANTLQFVQKVQIQFEQFV